MHCYILSFWQLKTNGIPLEKLLVPFISDRQRILWLIENETLPNIPINNFRGVPVYKLTCCKTFENFELCYLRSTQNNQDAAEAS